jgi:hypothetical protein
MTDQQAQLPANSRRNSTIGVVLAGYLIASFFWNIATEAHEYAMRTDQMLTMSLNLLGVVGLFGVRAALPKGLFWCALIAGIGLFAIRLTSDSAWWTGHLFYSVRAR